MRSGPSGAVTLLAGAVSYALRACAPVVPGEMSLSTPCAGWNLGTLIGHLSDAMADLETAIRTGRLDLPSPSPPPPPLAAGDPVEVLRDRAAELLCSAYGYASPELFVAVGGLPMPAGLVASTAAVEIAVHGWDVSQSRGGGQPIPAALATRLLALCPLLVAGREGLFAPQVPVPAQASPGDRLVGYLGRDPGTTPARSCVVTDE
ncbi:MAG: TIGR03086 family metal-binding protein [Streptosporangiaceae bacterium]